MTRTKSHQGKASRRRVLLFRRRRLVPQRLRLNTGEPLVGVLDSHALDHLRPKSSVTSRTPGFAAVCAALTILAGLAATGALAQPRIVETGYLRIASWDLSDAAATGAIVREKPATRSWRNTFGSERRMAEKPKFAGDRLQADVVLLQGVSSISEVRQIFPARDWKLLLSRQVLNLGGERSNTDVAGAGARTITAVALRYQLRLRMTALEHLENLDGGNPKLAEIGAALKAPAEGGSTGTDATRPVAAARAGNEEAGEQVPDGLALRLAYSGSVIWVVSAVLPQRCRTSSQTCEPAVRLKKWADAKRADGFHVVMGGQLDATLRQAGPNGVCASQEIVADRGLQAETGADTVAGCVVFADIGSR